MRIEAVIDAYLRHVTIERGLSEHTTAAYRRDLEAYRRWLEGEGIERIEAVTHAVTSDYLAARAGARPAPAASTLARSTNSAGVTFASLANTREKLRALMLAALARSAMVRSPVRLAST